MHNNLIFYIAVAIIALALIFLTFWPYLFRKDIKDQNRNEDVVNIQKSTSNNQSVGD